MSKGSARNCADLLKMGDTESGVRTVFSCYKNISFSVFCDQTTDGGGWTVFQRREDLPVREDFFLDWADYKQGFGNLTGEFWLGLEKIHDLVNTTQMELRVDLEDFEGEKRWAKYDNFYIEDSAGNYKLTLGTYDGDAGDSLSYHNDKFFSTKDRDNDHSSGNCADFWSGAWWFETCFNAHLNGFQHRGQGSPKAEGIIWKTFHGLEYSLKMTLLSVRPPVGI
ncbi:UNVERIFIED_CONTAM: hypothetical protein GTU68_005275 [Idotea baltica]|nr:hypothetical protein [Idotea baltica]